jgi:hypothetical protein
MDFFFFRQGILVLPPLQEKIHVFHYAFLIDIPFSGAQMRIEKPALR